LELDVDVDCSELVEVNPVIEVNFRLLSIFSNRIYFQGGVSGVALARAV
jgi:hypothetical protein